MATQQTYTVPQLRAWARSAATEHGLDPDVFEAQIEQESGFDVNARSGAGALGIAQFMPDTAKGLGIDPLNPLQALTGAARLMAGYVHQFGSMRDALVAYNAGPGNVGKALPAETRDYIDKILNGKKGIGGTASGSGAAGVGSTGGTDPSASSDSGTPGVLGPLVDVWEKGLIYLALIGGGAFLLYMGAKRASGTEATA